MGAGGGFLVFRALVDFLVFGGSGSDTEDGDVPFAPEIIRVSMDPLVEEASSSREAAGPGCSFIPVKPPCCAISVTGRKTIRGGINLIIVRHLANFSFLLGLRSTLQAVPRVTEDPRGARL